MFTRKEIEDKLKAGTIRGFTEMGKKYSAKQPKNIPVENDAEKKPTRQRHHKIKGWIAIQLEAWCDAHRLKLETEFMFDTDRLWQFDWAVAKKKIAFEYEGLNSRKSRHTTKAGYTGDTDKYNEATRQGWRVYRYTALNHKQLLKDLNNIL